jgi:hypothetical protein
VTIHIGRGQEKLGAFSEDEVRRGLRTGRFSLTDLGWKEGMENWTPLSQFEEFNAPPPPMPPLPSAPEPAFEAVEVVEEAHGLPWEDRAARGVVIGFLETVRLVMFSPAEAFRRMRTEGKLSAPLLYNVIGGWIGLVAAAIYAVLITRAQPAPTDLPKWQQALELTPEMAVLALKLYAILGPVIATVIVLISSAFTHLFLMLAGGANKAYHVTLRVFCFAWGSTQLLQLFPIGGPAAMVWMAICSVIGLTVAHGTTTGRSVAALAMLVFACGACCVGSLLLLSAVPGAGQ